jgi:hypothetical protein
LNGLRFSWQPLRELFQLVTIRQRRASRAPLASNGDEASWYRSRVFPGDEVLSGSVANGKTANACSMFAELADLGYFVRIKTA